MKNTLKIIILFCCKTFFKVYFYEVLVNGNYDKNDKYDSHQISIERSFY